jgi:hypothetical protein
MELPGSASTRCVLALIQSVVISLWECLAQPRKSRLHRDDAGPGHSDVCEFMNGPVHRREADVLH